MKSWVRIIALNALAAGIAWLVLHEFLMPVLGPVWSIAYERYTAAGYSAAEAAIAAGGIAVGFAIGVGLLFVGMMQCIKSAHEPQKDAE